MLGRAAFCGSPPEETVTAWTFAGSKAATAAPMGMRNALQAMAGGLYSVGFLNIYLLLSDLKNTRILLILGTFTAYTLKATCPFIAST